MDEQQQPTDPRPALQEAIAIATNVFDAVTADVLTDPTPCPDWNVRDLLGHLVGVARRIDAVGAGRPPMIVPIVVGGIADDGYPTAWRMSCEQAMVTWSDDELLGRIVSPPFGDMPGAVALGIYTSEITVHTWDLATAVGAEPEWNQEIAARSLAGIAAALPPSGRSAEMPFTDASPIADDAPAIERLVAFCGRQPV